MCQLQLILIRSNTHTLEPPVDLNMSTPPQIVKPGTFGEVYEVTITLVWHLIRKL